jgi:hypothetical protein
VPSLSREFDLAAGQDAGDHASGPRECAEIAVALAIKLACPRVVLTGCARESILDGLR